MASATAAHGVVHADDHRQPDPAGRNYLIWTPVKARVRLLDVEGTDAVTVTLRNDNTQVGGQLEFAATSDQVRAPSLDLVLPSDGTPVEFWVAGVMGKPSSADGDAVIRVARTGAAETLTSKAVMVRIRKNANQLGPAERDRFTTALAKLTTKVPACSGTFARCIGWRSHSTRRTGIPGSCHGTGPICWT
jgi:hypothetical protein